ncbi:hypothetical protein [Priestia aryabhattai]|jgi:hypothetical protein|uniref:hypothetical protein n=1 Tax=Priestia aryabhattai TaxID=412384 RepID=UPI0027E41B69|nr:hypothetical protein [Priestia aryabhattai]MCG0050225.1 hypothetical protein [Priestia aryabhattai]
MAIPLGGLKQIFIRFKNSDSAVETAFRLEEDTDIEKALEGKFIKVTNGSEWIHYNTDEIYSIRYAG